MRLPTHLVPRHLAGRVLGATTDLASDWMARRAQVPQVVVPAGAWIDLPGRGRTWLTDTGPRDAQPVILLHAIGCTGLLTWFPTVAELATTNRVIAFDQRWHGRATLAEHGRPETFSLRDCADDVAAVICALGLERPIVAGYSMGGVIAQHTWRRHRELVGGLVLAATSDHFRVTPHELLFHEGMELAGKALRVLAPVGAEQPSPSEAAYTATQVGRWALRELRSTSPLTVAQVLGVLGRHHSTPWLGLVDVPTAVVVTARDRLIPAGRQRALAALIPSATVHEVEVGHAGCVLEAGAFVPVVAEAIASVQGRLEAGASEQCG